MRSAERCITTAIIPVKAVPIATNVVFSGNYAGAWGGAMFSECENKGISKPVMTNVTFSGNAAGQKGGAIYSYRYGDTGTCSPDVRNSILWNNKDSSGTGTISATIYNDNSIISLTHSLVQGAMPGGTWIGGSYGDGGGNLDGNPQFVSCCQSAQRTHYSRGSAFAGQLSLY